MYDDEQYTISKPKDPNITNESKDNWYWDNTTIG